MKRIFIIAAAIITLASCSSSTQVQSSWKDPEAAINLSKLNKVLVVALLKNETYRRAAEGQLVSLLHEKAVASHSYLGDDLGKQNEEQLKQKLIKEGFDGVIILRLADVDKDIKYVPGNYATYPTYYTRFGPYFGSSWGYYSQPGYFESTKTFTIETNVYSFRKDRLIWTSLTSSVDPQSTDKLMKAVGKEVYNKMKKEGFIIGG